MRGIASGANIPLPLILALNARSEILSTKVPHNECTALCWRDSNILAQNWDWVSPLQNLACFLNIERSDGHKILTLTEVIISFS